MVYNQGCKVMTASNSEGVGKREAWRLKRNLQKDHCTTYLCCGTLRNMKLRFFMSPLVSEHFIHCFPMELSAWHLRVVWRGLAGREDPWLEVCPALQSYGGAALLPWVHSTVPCQVQCPISSHHISLCGVSAHCHWRESYSSREKCSFSSTFQWNRARMQDSNLMAYNWKFAAFFLSEVYPQKRNYAILLDCKVLCTITALK